MDTLENFPGQRIYRTTQVEFHPAVCAAMTTLWLKHASLPGSPSLHAWEGIGNNQEIGGLQQAYRDSMSFMPQGSHDENRERHLWEQADMVFMGWIVQGAPIIAWQMTNVTRGMGTGTLAYYVIMRPQTHGATGHAVGLFNHNQDTWYFDANHGCYKMNHTQSIYAFPSWWANKFAGRQWFKVADIFRNAQHQQFHGYLPAWGYGPARTSPFSQTSRGMWSRGGRW